MMAPVNVPRNYWRVCCLAMTPLLIAGCATVEPAGDYTRASALIEERTGASDSFDPESDDAVTDKVHALLADGLSAPEASTLALLNNREFQALFFDVGLSRADVVQAGLLSNPSLSFGLLAPIGGGRDKLTFGVAQEIAELWQIPARKRAAEGRLEETILRVAQAAVDTDSRAQAAWYRAVGAQALEDNAREAQALGLQVVNMVRQSLEAGNVSQLDLDRADAAYLLLESNLSVAQQETAAAVAGLASELGLSFASEPVTLEAFSEPDMTALPGDECLVEFAAEQVFEAKLAEQAVKTAENAVTDEQRKWLRSVKVGLSGERSAARDAPSRLEQGLAAWKPSDVIQGLPSLAAANDPLGAAQALNGILPTLPTQRQVDLSRSQQIRFLWGPNVQVTLPIFDLNQAQIARAALLVEKQRKHYEAVVEAIAGNVLARAARVRGLAAQLALYRDRLLPLVERNAEGAGRVYAAGQEGIVSLLQAQQDRTATRRDYLLLLRDYGIARALLAQALGGKLPGDMEVTPNNE